MIIRATKASAANFSVGPPGVGILRGIGMAGVGFQASEITCVGFRRREVTGAEIGSEIVWALGSSGVGHGRARFSAIHLRSTETLAVKRVTARLIFHL